MTESGTAESPITIIAEAADSTITVTGTGFTGTGVHDVVLDGLKFYQNTVNGITFDDSYDITIQNCLVDDNDVDGIELVLNYDVPPDPEDYVHRIGRTARGTNNKGTAITFINDKDQKRFDAIEKLIERDIPKRTIPESIGTSPVYNPLAKTTFKRKPSKPNFKKKNGGTNS
jgi:hypothetical protein